MANDDGEQRRRRPQQNEQRGNSFGSAVAIGAVAVGAFVVGRSIWNTYLAKVENVIDNEDAAPSLSRQQIDHRLQACKGDARTLCGSLIPLVNKAVVQCTPVSAARRQLQAARQQQSGISQHEAWHEIRVATWTRLVANAYCHSILFCMVWSHVHRIEQQVLRNTTSSTRTTTTTSVSTLWCRSFVDHGIAKGIVHPIRTVVERVLASTDDWDCFEPTVALRMTADTVEQTLLRICQESNYVSASTTHDETSRSSPLQWWVGIAADELSGTTAREEDELLDLWESPLAQHALRECLACTLENTIQLIRSSMFQQAHERPVAKVVAELKTTGNDWEASWLQYSRLPSVRDLGRAVLLDGCTEQ